jgi:hypothetical protein
LIPAYTVDRNQKLVPTSMEPNAKLRLRSKRSELAPGAADRRGGAAAAVGDLSAAAAAASMG